MGKRKITWTDVREVRKLFEPLKEDNSKLEIRSVSKRKPKVSDKSKEKKCEALLRESTTKAVPALMKHVKGEKGASDLFEDGDHFALIFALKELPKRRLKPYPIEIPHPFMGPGDEICLFVKDPHKEIKRQVKETSTRRVKVIGYTKLKTNYKTFQSKRKLFGSYDLFLTDDRLAHLLLPVLGNAFSKRNRMPVPIKIGENTAENIEKACSSLQVYFGNGVTTYVRVGKTSQTSKEVIANVIATTTQLVKYLPGGWDNILSINLKTSESVAIPIYNIPFEIDRIEKSKTTEDTNETPKDLPEDEDMDEEDLELQRKLQKILDEEDDFYNHPKPTKKVKSK